MKNKGIKVKLGPSCRKKREDRHENYCVRTLAGPGNRWILMRYESRNTSELIYVMGKTNAMNREYWIWRRGLSKGNF